MASRKLLLYFAFSFGISWAVAGMLYVFTEGSPSPLLMMLAGGLYMWGPALAVLIVQKGLYRGSLVPYGWTLRQIDGRWLLASLLVPLLVFLLYLATVGLLGNALDLPGMGRVDLSLAGMSAQLDHLAAEAGQPANMDLLTSIPLPGWALLPLLLLAALIPGATLNALFALGEELGWRGLMLHETQHLGFWRSNLFIGIVWGLWHSPFILMGHNYPGKGWLGIPVMVVFCVSISFVMAYLTRRTGSIVSPSIFHGVINAIAGFGALYVHGADSLIGSIAGLAGAVPGLLLTIPLLYLGTRHLLPAPIEADS